MGAKQDNEWWARLAHVFQAHVREESYFLDEYEKLADSIADPGTRYLINLILEDERHHHDMFSRLAAATRGEGGEVPPRPMPSPEEARHILEATERFLEAENEDRVKLRKLAKELKTLETGHWHLLVALTDLDTRKHVTILEFLLAALRAQAKR